MKVRIFILLSFALFTAIIHGQSIPIDSVSKHIGDSISICGKVAEVFKSKRADNPPTLINFGQAYPNTPFTAVVFEDVAKTIKFDLDKLEGKKVCVSGKIILYKDKPEVIIYKAEQILDKP